MFNKFCRIMRAINILILCAISFFCQAQQWQIDEQAADELRGTKGMIKLTYNLSWGDYFTCVKGEWDSFTIHTQHVFDSKLIDSDYSFNRCCDVRIGLYNSNSELIKVYPSVRLIVSDKNDRMISLKHSEIAREILYHLFNTNGYIRILIPHAFSEEDFEMKIPHYPRPE